MFDYDGDIIASLTDYESLLTTVIQETFPTAAFILRIRQTKAMQHPKISIEVADGPLCADMAHAVPILAEVATLRRWAYCGKVLPALNFRISSGPKTAYSKYSKLIWEQMLHDDPYLRNCNPKPIYPDKGLPLTFALYQQRLVDHIRGIHPVCQSATMAQIAPGRFDTIEQIANEQRRDELARCTPQAADANHNAICPPRRVRL